MAVAQKENISRSTALLPLTQLTFSRQWGAEVKAPLFVRCRHVVLTDAGLMLRRRGEEIFT
ncbi:LysR family transcriptional regulator [uncultured Megasphaera sp.]|uniref:Transcriptional regulator, LysR family n=1 Tax=Megasphaera vaginalis (ex Srinivasan et al. 2021) TaxID=1111454 RepID=U7UU18_9FIRM|nr:LysR family transcriptional regulator [uncultured Megasphaera sp.]ERT61963.1 transcriptional regulator, LysR family [Megasphaera vaginalis (ex Srinivasan et al. 2021)]